MTAVSALLRRFDRDFALEILRSALAATLAWELAVAVLPARMPFFASLTAFLTVTATLYASLARAVQRTLAVVAGVLVAFALALLLGLHWWSIALVVALGMLLGRWRHLGDQGVQVPIAGLVVLTLSGSSPDSFVSARILETLLGAAVGAAVSLLVAPPVHLNDAGTAVGDLADEIAALLREIGTGTAEPWSAAQAESWLRRGRELDDLARTAFDALERGEESMRFNPRHRRAIVLPHLAEALRALEHASVQARGIARTVRDIARDIARDAGSDPARARAGSAVPVTDFGAAYAGLLARAADVVEAFGRHEYGPASPGSGAAFPTLVAALRADARALAAQHWRVGADDATGAARRGSLLTDLSRLLAELSDREASALIVAD